MVNGRKYPCVRPCVPCVSRLPMASFYRKKDTGEEPGPTHGTHKRTRATRTHGSHRRTSQPSKPNDTPARPRDGRNRGRLNSRKSSRRPGADRSPRPTQKRPPPANPTLPPPAPRAPPRACSCSKAVGRNEDTRAHTGTRLYMYRNGSYRYKDTGGAGAHKLPVLSTGRLDGESERFARA